MANGFKFIFSSMLAIFVIVFVVCLYRMCADLPMYSFDNFLNSLSGVPDVTFTLYSNDPLAGDWGIFDFLRTFLNTIANIVNFIVYAISMLLQILVFVWYFIQSFFVVAPVSA